MYRPEPPDTTRRDHAACGIGFLASRKGVAERRLVDIALDLCQQFDHRGAPGHGAGLLLDIPWPLLLDRFPEHTRAIAQRDVALGMFFLPFDAGPRRDCVDAVEELAALAGRRRARLGRRAGQPRGAAARARPRGARRPSSGRRSSAGPPGLGEEGWFACRYLLRLALDEIADRTSATTSRSAQPLEPHGRLQGPRRAVADRASSTRTCATSTVASRFVLFHSRYSHEHHDRLAARAAVLGRSRTTARSRPSAATSPGCTRSARTSCASWSSATRRLRRDRRRSVRSIICARRLRQREPRRHAASRCIAGGLSLPQALLALLPEAPSHGARPSPRLAAFHEAMGVLLGACDGPAAIVACDGDEAVAHLDRNGLRPLWITTTRDYALAVERADRHASTSARSRCSGIFGPGDTAVVKLGQRRGAADGGGPPHGRGPALPDPAGPRRRAQTCGGGPPAHAGRPAAAAGRVRHDAEDVDVVLAAAHRGPASSPMGSMGDDTPPAALLDAHAAPARRPLQAPLRAGDEPADRPHPRRVGVRDGRRARRPLGPVERGGGHRTSSFPTASSRRASCAGCARSRASSTARRDVRRGRGAGRASSARSRRRVEAGDRAGARTRACCVLSDRAVGRGRARRCPALRARRAACTTRSCSAGCATSVGLVADCGVWDVHHCALLVVDGRRRASARGSGCADRGRGRGSDVPQGPARRASSKRCR